MPAQTGQTGGRKTVRLRRRTAGEAASPPVIDSAGPVTGPVSRVYQSTAAAPPDDWGEIARIYDLEHPACRGAELAFWHRAAAEAGGDVLELAAGSGRVAIALARKGHRVTGLELSHGMLARARARTEHLPPDVQARLEWVQGDMADFALPGRRFGLVFVAFNSFWLLDPAGQARCLRRCAHHLAPGGRLVLDLFPPNEDDYHDEAGITQFIPAPRHERMLIRVKDYTFDPARRMAISDVRYYAEGPGAGQAGHGARLLATFRYCLHPAEPASVRALLESQGFVVEATYGSYGVDPLTPNAPRAIFVARLRGDEVATEQQVASSK